MLVTTYYLLEILLEQIYNFVGTFDAEIIINQRKVC